METSKEKTDYFLNQLNRMSVEELQEIISGFKDVENRQNLAQMLAKRRYQELRNELAKQLCEWEMRNIY